MWNYIILALLGGVVFGLGFGGLVHEAVTRLAPPHQAASGEALYGGVLGLGVSLMLVASWLRNRS